MLQDPVHPRNAVERHLHDSRDVINPPSTELGCGVVNCRAGGHCTLAFTIS